MERKGGSIARGEQLKMNSALDGRIHPIQTLCSLRQSTTMNQAQFSEMCFLPGAEGFHEE